MFFTNINWGNFFNKCNLFEKRNGTKKGEREKEAIRLVILNLGSHRTLAKSEDSFVYCDMGTTAT